MLTTYCLNRGLLKPETTVLFPGRFASQAIEKVDYSAVNEDFDILLTVHFLHNTLTLVCVNWLRVSQLLFQNFTQYPILSGNEPPRAAKKHFHWLYSITNHLAYCGSGTNLFSRIHVPMIPMFPWPHNNDLQETHTSNNATHIIIITRAF